MTQLIVDTEHYYKVLSKCKETYKTLWIGTADIKDLYISNGKTEKPFLGVLSELIGKGVNVRLIHQRNQLTQLVDPRT